MALCRFDGTEGVNIDTAEVVVILVPDAAGHQAGIGHVPSRGMGIRGIARNAAVALAARVHDEVRVSGLRPACVLVGQPPATRVADELNHNGQALPGLEVCGEVQPALDPVAAEAGEGDVKGVDDGEVVVDGLEGGIEGKLARFLNGPVPERLEVGRLDGAGGVVAELFEGKVEKRHGPFQGERGWW